ncbi:hypothetical protein EG327_004223 [Venturia inaequalis]|uniref:Geranylgeranyl pyrophosphate synthetase n=1 Tax=Venturia inaequalis TaxID=5025 RepID=A0A8H3VF58_VENIN|nr:hypothetical protein EG327_004223 [Venturia inaequalis]
MIPLQAPGAGRGTPNHHLSPNAPSFTPTSRGRGGGRGFRRRDMPQTDAPMIAELSRETLHHMFTAEETKITDFEHLASYNWLDERNPTIAVPGMPSRLDQPSTAVRVRPDYGKSFIDQNAARNPDSPLEPLFRSLFALRPNYDVSAIDLVSDRNNIRKLLRFVTNNGDEFEIKVEIVGDKTLLLTRVEPETECFSNGKQGYGHNFEDVVTKDHIGTGHHRVASYCLGGLKMINRSECDGYLNYEIGTQAFPSSAELVADPHVTASPTRRNPPRVARQKTPGISNLLDGLSISTPISTNGTSLAGSKAQSSSVATNSTRYIPPALRGVQVGGVQVKYQGSSIPASQIIEIKTRVASKQLNYTNILAQMWASQTRHLVAGYFDDGGWFRRIECNDITSRIQEWEERNENNLQKLVALIKWIRDNVQNVEEKRATLRYEGRDSIRIMGLEPQEKALGPHLPHMRNAKKRAAMRGKSLPDDLYAKWDSPGLSAPARNCASREALEDVEGEDNGGVRLA